MMGWSLVTRKVKHLVRLNFQGLETEFYHVVNN